MWSVLVPNATSPGEPQQNQVFSTRGANPSGDPGDLALGHGVRIMWRFSTKAAEAHACACRLNEPRTYRKVVFGFLLREARDQTGLTCFVKTADRAQKLDSFPCAGEPQALGGLRWPGTSARRFGPTELGPAPSPQYGEFVLDFGEG